jgi:hypothetical protein
MQLYNIEMTRASSPGGTSGCWPRWAAIGAAGWSLGYGLLATFWAAGGPGFPFGTVADPGAGWSALADVGVSAAAWPIAVLALVGAAVAALMAWAPRDSRRSAAMLCFAWGMAALLTLGVPDYRLLAALAYAPVLLVGALFGWAPVGYRAALTWPLLNQGLCLLGGLLWAAAHGYRRRTRGACAACGRAGSEARWTTPAAASHWGWWASAIAAVAPMPYVITRWAWAFGIPLGISEPFLRLLQSTGLWLVGARLATVASCGSLLTLGLAQPWGEVFPRWVPVLDGRRVPPALAIVPATLVAVTVTTTGLMFVRVVLRDGHPPEGWAVLGPELLWPIWGIALGAATLAYAYRRRGSCPACGRGLEASPQALAPTSTAHSEGVAHRGQRP